MKSYAKGLAALVVVTGIAVTVVACGARYHHQSPEQRADWFIGKIERKLDLNDDQKAKLMLVRDRMLATRQAMHGKDDDKGQQALAVIAGRSFDRDKAMTIFEDKTATMKQHGPEVISALADFYDSLDEAQQQKVREHLKERMEYHHGPGGWEGHHGWE